MKPYRFSSEDQARLDAHFGSREVWLPMEVDDLVAALVQSQAEWVLDKAGLISSTNNSKVRETGFGHPDQNHHDQEVTMSTVPTTKPKRDLSALSAQLVEDVKSTFPGVELTQKSAYIRAHLGRTTLGYLYPSPNGGKSAVETIKLDGSGKYTYQAIATKADLTKAINAMKAVQKAAEKKAAKAAKAS